MNEAEMKAQAAAARIVRITNPFDFDFTHAWGGVPYNLPVGVPRMFPYPLADHLATHLARQALIRKAPFRDGSETDGKGSDRPLWSEETIDAMKAKIMVEEYTEEVPAVPSEAETMRRKIDALQKMFEERIATQPAPSASTEAVVADPADPSAFKDKSEVIEELKKRDIKYDARKSKAELEKLLAE